ncbi:MAG: multicopper oxidase domain-containing protein [Candidatus Kapaibacterium sp.]
MPQVFIPYSPFRFLILSLRLSGNYTITNGTTMKISTRMQTVIAATLLLWATGAVAQPTFINKIPIPPLIDANTDTIHLEMRVTTHKFNPGDTNSSLNGGEDQPDGIRTYAYNVRGDSTMTVLGPTLKFHTLGQTNITVKNLIGTPSTTHWHGAEVPVQMDGGPHQGINPGDTWQVNFSTLDSASTMWYHPHYHNKTVQHVQKGLSGMILVEDQNDPIRNTMPHTYHADDIPVIIGDVGFSGSPDTLMYVDTVKGKRPYNLVNGVTNPYVEVPAHLVRLRILNGSTRKGIMFGVSESYDDPLSDLKEFYLIATDGGYTLKPDTLTTLITGPGARAEIVLDLSNYIPGDVLYLSNLKELLPNSVIGSPLKAPNGGGQDTTIGTAFLQLRIVPDAVFDQYDYTPITSFTPFTTTWTPGLSDTSNIAKHRFKQLVMQLDTVSLSPLKTENAFTIDSVTFNMHMLNDTVCVDTKEIWAIHNTTAVAHPFHIHKIQFRVLDAVDSLGNNINLEEHGLNGPKDDVLVFPGWTLRFLAQFDDYPSAIAPMNGYMYHCHILTHEDSVGGGMMGQFVVTDQGVCANSSVINVKSDHSEMVLIPNGEEGILYVKGESLLPSTVTIVDLQGRQMLRQELSAFEGSAAVNIADLPSGLYLIEWRTAERVMTGKVQVLK